MRRGRIRAGLVVLVVTAGSACSQGGEGQADCSQRVRLDGVTYTGWSATEADARRAGTAERSSCDDFGPDAKGAYFGDEPERVPVWVFDGYSPDEVLGVRLDKASYIIFVAESLADADRDRIVEELGASGDGDRGPAAPTR